MGELVASVPGGMLEYSLPSALQREKIVVFVLCVCVVSERVQRNVFVCLCMLGFSKQMSRHWCE